MKIACTGAGLPEGKRKLGDSVFQALVDKYDPDKVTPYYFEFLPDAYEAGEAIAIAESQVLDLLILDMEKAETRLDRTEEAGERAALELCLAHFEQGLPACDIAADEKLAVYLKSMGFLSLKPTVVVREPDPDIDTLCRQVMDKAGVMFFYTAGKQEVHAWMVPQGADAVTCAGRIHSDLARGFVKAEVVPCQDLLAAHGMQDARAKGLTRLVDRDYVVGENLVLDIRFNV